MHVPTLGHACYCQITVASVCVKRTGDAARFATLLEELQFSRRQVVQQVVEIALLTRFSWKLPV